MTTGDGGAKVGVVLGDDWMGLILATLPFVAGCLKTHGSLSIYFGSMVKVFDNECNYFVFE